MSSLTFFPLFRSVGSESEAFRFRDLFFIGVWGSSLASELLGNVGRYSVGVVTAFCVTVGCLAKNLDVVGGTWGATGTATGLRRVGVFGGT